MRAGKSASGKAVNPSTEFWILLPGTKPLPFLNSSYILDHPRGES